MASQDPLFDWCSGRERWEYTTSAEARKFGIPPIQWTDDVTEKVIRWAGYWAGKYRFDDEVRDDLVGECLEKAYRKVSEGRIYHIGALNLLCRTKGLDMIRKLKRRKETGMPETVEWASVDEPETMLSEAVFDEFPLLYFAGAMETGGHSKMEIAESLGMSLNEFLDWLPKEQEKARKFFGVQRVGNGDHS